MARSRGRCWKAVAAAGILVVTACGGAGDDTAGGDETAGDGPGGGGVELVASDRPREAAPPGAPVADVVAGIDGFAGDAERIVAREGGNTVLSPLSMAVAFAMVRAGADDDTGRAVAEVFGFPDQPGLHDAMNALTAALAGVERPAGEDGGEVTLRVADSVWTQAGFDVEPAFLDTLATRYGAGVRAADFVDDPAGSRAAINGWVAEATRDRITDLVGEDAITEDTRLMLVDAVYLKAAWAAPFAEEATAPGPFHRADGSTVEAPMMRAPGLDARHGRGDGYTAVELPYAGGELAMTVVLPDEGVPLDDLAARLAEGSGGAGGGFAGVAATLAPAAVDLTLPRWEATAAVDLAPVMTELGLPIPGGRLPGIAPDLEIGTAVHAADITVDEAGTEAAAATAVGIELTSAPAAPVPVTVDRPFLYAVRHVDSGAPLFVGRVVDPAAGG